jgi:hypothetical protein
MAFADLAMLERCSAVLLANAQKAMNRARSAQFPLFLQEL